MMSSWKFSLFNYTTPNNGRKQSQPLDSTDGLSNSSISKKRRQSCHSLSGTKSVSSNSLSTHSSKSRKRKSNISNTKNSIEAENNGDEEENESNDRSTQVCLYVLEMSKIEYIYFIIFYLTGSFSY